MTSTVTTATEQVLRRVPVGTPESLGARRRRRRLLELGLAAGIPAALVALWQVASDQEWISSRIYPPPSRVVSAVGDLWSAGRLQDAILDSLQVILAGFVIGALAGFAVGVLTGASALAKAALEPLLMGLYVVPKLAMLPVFLTVFGFGTAPKVALVVVTVFFFVWIDVMEAMWRIPEGYLEAARSLRLSRWGTFQHVRLPGVLPNLLVSLRISIGVAVLVTIAAEFIVGGTGLGYLIFSSNQYFLLDRVYAGIVTVALLGVLLSWLIAFAGRRLTPWIRGRAR
ncbi:MAG: ABC transporter permease [Nocardioidaceae bacterium]|nr:ABC transporter permease [Nocardioidaceae bacterium]